MRLVIIESPYAGMIGRNIAYGLECVRDCLSRGEAPIASHLLHPRVLDDDVSSDRELGIAAGLAWGRVADATVVYVDLGVSSGMKDGITNALKAGRTVEYRKINDVAAPQFDPVATRNLR